MLLDRPIDKQIDGRIEKLDLKMFYYKIKVKLFVYVKCEL